VEFWAAFGAIATAAGSLVAFMHFRKKDVQAVHIVPQPPLDQGFPLGNISDHDSSKKLENLSVEIRSNTLNEKKLAFQTKSLSCEVPDYLNLHILDSLIEVTDLQLHNQSGQTLHDVRLRLGIGHKIWGHRVEDCTSLATQAVRLELDGLTLKIQIEQIPANECIHISVFEVGIGAGFTSLKSENANVQLYRKHFDGKLS
jgi:hypothetical protein